MANSAPMAMGCITSHYARTYKLQKHVNRLAFYLYDMQKDAHKQATPTQPFN